MLLVQFLLVVTDISLAQEQSKGTCPNYQDLIVKNFDVQRYLGRWYGYSRYFARFGRGKTCSTVFYSDGTQPGGPTTINVMNRGFNPETGKYTRALATAVPADPAQPASLVLNFYFPPSSRPASTTPGYNVIDTDYTSFAVVYYCRQANQTTKSEGLFVLTRERHPPQQLVDRAYASIERQGIDTMRLTKNVQTGCPELNTQGELEVQ